MSRQSIAAYRRRPEGLPGGWPAVSPSNIRHADDQTITALVSLTRALHSVEDANPGHFDDWGIVAAPRFLGRSHIVKVLNRYDSEGVWGVSPHVIPHFALHSQSGTLSLALGIRGPNVGVGGGVTSALDGWLTAFTWLSSGLVPGVWLVFTGWYPEFVADSAGEPLVECECRGLALGIVPTNRADRRPILRVVPRDGEGASPDLLAFDDAVTYLAHDPDEDDGRWIAHRGAKGIPRPHSMRKPIRPERAVVLAEDGPGRWGIELIYPMVPEGVEEAR